MDRDRRAIVPRTEPGLTVKNIGQILDLLEANYGSRLYRDTDRKNVVALWSSMFAKDNPYEVLTAVKEYMETETYPPTVADIKRIIRENRKPGIQPLLDAVEEANRMSRKLRGCGGVSRYAGKTREGQSIR